jgi:hypothetical protein
MHQAREYIPLSGLARLCDIEFPITCDQEQQYPVVVFVYSIPQISRGKMSAVSVEMIVSGHWHVRHTGMIA